MARHRIPRKQKKQITETIRIALLSQNKTIGFDKVRWIAIGMREFELN